MNQELSRNIDFDSLTNIKCPISGHKKLYTHVCTKPHCTKSRLYCSKCILIPNHECSKNIVLLEDIVLQNYESLDGWIPDQCVRDLLNREENDESLKIPTEKEIKDYINKKLEPTIASFMEEIMKSIESIKNELTSYIKKEFELRKECFKKIKEYYDCDMITDMLKSSTNLQKLQNDLNGYFNNRNFEDQHVIMQAAKVINLHPLKSDQLKIVTKNFNELKSMMSRLLKIEPKKFEENNAKLKTAINSIGNIITKFELTKNIPGTAGGGSFGNPAETITIEEGNIKYPEYDKPFNLESYLKKTHSHANIMTPIRRMTPSLERSKAKTFVLDTVKNVYRENDISNVEYNSAGTGSNTPRATHILLESRKQQQQQQQLQYQQLQQHSIHQIIKNDNNDNNIPIGYNYNTSATPRDRPLQIVLIGDKSFCPDENTPLTKRNETPQPNNATTGTTNNSNSKMIESVMVDLPIIPQPSYLCTPSQFNPNSTIDSRKHNQSKQGTYELVLVNHSPGGYNSNNNNNNNKLYKPSKKGQGNHTLESVMIDLSPGLSNMNKTISTTDRGKKTQKPLSLIDSEYVQISPGGSVTSRATPNTDGIRKILTNAQKKVDSRRHEIDQDIKRKLFSISHMRGVTKG